MSVRAARGAVSRACAAWCMRAIRWYQRRLSAYTAGCCKYYPTCSQYALEALRRFGLIRGLALAALRLARCRPWSDGGIDDVPQRFSLCYRLRWSRAHEEPRLEPLPRADEALGAPQSAESFITQEHV